MSKSVVGDPANNLRYALGGNGFRLGYGREIEWMTQANPLSRGLDAGCETCGMQLCGCVLICAEHDEWVNPRDRDAKCGECDDDEAEQTDAAFRQANPNLLHEADVMKVCLGFAALHGLRLMHQAAGPGPDTLDFDRERDPDGVHRTMRMTLADARRLNYAQLEDALTSLARASGLYNHLRVPLPLAPPPSAPAPHPHLDADVDRMCIEFARETDACFEWINRRVACREHRDDDKLERLHFEKRSADGNVMVAEATLSMVRTGGLQILRGWFETLRAGMRAEEMRVRQATSPLHQKLNDLALNRTPPRSDAPSIALCGCSHCTEFTAAGPKMAGLPRLTVE